MVLEFAASRLERQQSLLQVDANIEALRKIASRGGERGEIAQGIVDADSQLTSIIDKINAFFAAHGEA